MKTEIITRSDFSALETIAMIISNLKNDPNPSLGDYDWAIDMIHNEVVQTGRSI